MNTIINKVIPKLDRFFFAPSNSKVLGFFRIAIAVCCIIQITSVYPDLLNIFGAYGFNRGEVVEIMLSDFMPRISWLATALEPIGIGEITTIYGLFFFYLFVLVMLGLGLGTRAFALLALFIHLMFFGSGKVFMYGADYFTSSCLFYCLIMPVGRFWSIDNLIWKRPRGYSSGMVTFFVRLLQVHLCFVYFFGGFSKMLGTHWWNGLAIWRAVSVPGFYELDMTFLASFPWISLIVGWSVLILEFGYPILMSFRKTRLLCLLSIIGMHIGIAIVMGLHQFATIMIVLNVSAFGWPYLEKWWAKKRHNIAAFEYKAAVVKEA